METLFCKSKLHKLNYFLVNGCILSLQKSLKTKKIRHKFKLYECVEVQTVDSEIVIGIIAMKAQINLPFTFGCFKASK